jgi:hypothetical protein
MKLRTALQAATLVVGTFFCGVALAYGGFTEMTRRVPRDANVIMYMDVERLLASPMAASEKWKDKQAADYHTRPFSVPPAVTRFLRAAVVNIDTNPGRDDRR